MEGVEGSFRDPCGFVFTHEGVVYRAIARPYSPQYERLHASGLYDELTSDGLLVSHEEVHLEVPFRPVPWKILRPRQIPFVSYPYEWSPGQLQAAAALTIEIQRRALARGMTLKDASAFNVQFEGVTPVLVDTLSFERYIEGTPWKAYHQFCTHFLAPLALATRRDHRLLGLLQRFIDGVPLDLASRLLPVRSMLSPGIAIHVHAHARAVTRRDGGVVAKPRGMPLTAQQALVGSLAGMVQRLSWRIPRTLWSDYRETNAYGPDDTNHKKRIVTQALEQVSPTTTWDLGANTGDYSRLASERGATVVAVDSDVAAVERHFRELRDRGEHRTLPLVVDVANPSPGLGWNGAERSSLFERGPADLVMALALVHHLHIGGGVPFDLQIQALARLGRYLLVEWVPPGDQQVRRMVAHRPDPFPGYTEAAFDQALTRWATPLWRKEIGATGRVLHLVRVV